MKAISDNSAFPREGVVQCQRFGNWGIGDGVSIKYRACSRHLHRVLTILYTEQPGSFRVIPLRELPPPP